MVIAEVLASNNGKKVVWLDSGRLVMVEGLKEKNGFGL
jgi:hypothetical protein